MADYSPIFKNWRVRLVVAVVVLALLAVALKGSLNTGIEFRGGVRIPISIVSEKDVPQDVMASTIDTIKQRINKLGLSQAVVRPLGGREIIVEVPRADESVIKTVETILRQQGKFEAIIDEKQALSGTDIVPNAVGGAQGERVTPSGTDSYTWELDFAVNREGGEKFAGAAKGRADYPVYMFLDRPENAAIIAEQAEIYNASIGIGNSMQQAIDEVLKKQGDDIQLIYADSTNDSVIAAQAALANRTTIVMTRRLAQQRPAIVAALALHGFSSGENATSKRIILVDDASMAASSYSAQIRGSTVSTWKAIGLLSAPVLSAGLANGYVSQLYSVTGTISGVTPQDAQKNAVTQIKELKSLISGGKLPVSTIVGSAYVVAPSLGEQFLLYSAFGIFAAIVAVMGLIAIRYKRIALVVPIILVNLVEIMLTTIFMGIVGTIDLAAVAGIVGIIGTGVNDQIIITDELLRRGKTEEDVLEARGIKDRIKNAFFIIFTVAGVAIAAMLPLLLSGIVEIMGFALSTIVGILIGVGITRPA
ncbi:MAG: hypothetical protein V1708_05285, partial [Candidatus Micrarchaeota archaeon]